MSKILHVLSDSPYTYKFVKFIERNFDSNKHMFIIFCSSKTSEYLEFYRTNDNCIVTTNKTIYFKYRTEFKLSKKVILHQMNHPRMMLALLFFYPDIFNKIIWSIWGGDVYFYKYKTGSLKDNLIELLRKIVIKKIPIITSWVRGDYQRVVDVYNTRAKYIKSKYPSPIDFKNIYDIPERVKKNGEIVILVGNSADPSNEHILTYKLLEKYKNNNIKVCSVLSYGGDKNYIKNVIEVGNKIFRGKFEPILNYMDFEAYLQFLASCDVCVLNHKRQQGLGNQVVFLALGKKLFISNATSPFKYYSDLGINIHSTESIKNFTFSQLIMQDKKSKDENIAKMCNEMSESVIKDEWNNVFKLL